ncbi:ABC transporter permease [Acuticoccus mangrovi]|uniref:ABC transporter permease n=1 Tax=Acuticoccus mangrovi TaxID=2796142 RepID=UPI001B3B4B05|nr:ABC transporter permease [Acuticoccus mangrovi]
MSTGSYRESVAVGDGEVLVAPALPDLFEDRGRRSALAAVLAHKAIVIGAAIVLVITLMAVCAPWLTPIDPTAIAPLERLKGPSLAHPFGTDMLGRDLFSRVLYGARISLFVGFVIAALSSIIGLVIGLVAGYWRRLDGIVMRLMDALMSIPGILLAIAFMAISGGSMGNVILAITIVEVPRVARLVRGTVLSVRRQAYVEAAVASGSRSLTILLSHILPNTIAPIIIQATYVCASAMLLESVLSFIGAGIPPSIPTWGNIMADGRSIWQLKPSMIFLPALFLSLTILAINLVGDGLRDLLDPRQAGNG